MFQVNGEENTGLKQKKAMNIPQNTMFSKYLENFSTYIYPSNYRNFMFLPSLEKTADHRIKSHSILC